MLSLFKRRNKADPPKEAFTEHLNVRYPPLRQGVPFYSVDECIQPHLDIINRIRLAVRFTKEQESELLLPLLRRFASYAHLLPASQNDHHRAAGGLIRHSLEVGYYSATSAGSTVFGGEQGENYQSLVKDNYLYAAFIAGLLHDLGKVFSDMHVRCAESGEHWRPLQGNIIQWFTSIQSAGKYHVIFRKRVNKLHESFSLFGLERVIGQADIDYMTRDGRFPEVYEHLILAMSGSLRTRNMDDVETLTRLMKAADSRSVTRDLQGRMEVVGDDSSSIPIEESLVSKLIHLIDIGVITVNEGNSRVYVGNKCSYLLWSDDLCAQLVEECLNSGISVPEGSKRLFDILFSKKVFKGNGASRGAIDIDVKLPGNISKQVKAYELCHKGFKDYLADHDALAIRSIETMPITSDKKKGAPKPKPSGKTRNPQPSRTKPDTTVIEFKEDKGSAAVSFSEPNNTETASQDCSALLDIDFSAADERPKESKRSKKPKKKPAKSDKEVQTAQEPEASNIPSLDNPEAIGRVLAGLVQQSDLIEEFETDISADSYTIRGRPQDIYEKIASLTNKKTYQIRQWIGDFVDVEETDINEVTIKVGRGEWVT
ncbi:MAG: hypothetical protein C9356_15665 [Oleiphilus sp.]|nr:MAG: hypothetical protein C9356_15665 [Oleiphilus sp.]